MTRSSLWLQPLVLAIVGVLAGWAGNNLPTLKDDLKLPIPSWGVLLLAVVASFALNALPLLWGEATTADRRVTSRGWISCLSPLVASGVLFFLVHAGHIPQSMVASCLYASLVLFVVAAILPPLLVLKMQRQSRATFQTRGQISSADADITNRDRLLKAVSIEVEGRLRSAFHNRVRLILSKEALPTEVQPPWNQEVKDRNQAPIAIDSDTSILTIFERPEIAGGKLLVLGEPGSGKTTTLLELAKALIERAREDMAAPMPVVLGLSSWQGAKQEFSSWLLSQLKLKYNVRESIGQRWLDEGKILPLLDGLDEVAPKSQIACIRAINEFRREFTIDQLVVCSRIEEYQQLQIQLELNAAVYLQPLNPSQIREYCLRVVGPNLWNAVQANSNLLDLVKTPFFIGIVGVVWQRISEIEWQQAQFQGKQQNLLLGAYIRQRLENTDAQRAKSVKRWLSWLAKNLQQHNSDEFLIEVLQPDWLMQKRLERSYRVSVGLFFGLLFGLFFGRLGGLFVGLSFGLFSGLTSGLSSIYPHESVMNLSWKEARDGLFSRLLFGLFFGLFSGLFFGLFSGLLFGLISELGGAEIQIKTIPNQGIKASAINALIGGLFFGLSLGLFFGLSLGLISGLSLGLLLGGGVVVQHFILRLFLACKSYAPWDYPKFLNYATADLILLQRVGGGYRFIHALLRTRFAEIWDEEEVE